MKARRSYLVDDVVSDIVGGRRSKDWIRNNPYRAAVVAARERTVCRECALPCRAATAMLVPESWSCFGGTMRVAELFTTNTHQSPRVRDDELDLFGLTHPGK